MNEVFLEIAVVELTKLAKAYGATLEEVEAIFTSAREQAKREHLAALVGASA